MRSLVIPIGNPDTTEDIEPLARMAQEITSAADLQAVFRAVFMFASTISPAAAVFVALYDPVTQLRRCVYAAGVADGGNGERVLEEDEELGVFPEVPLNDGPQSRAIVTGETVNLPDLESAVRGLPRVDAGSDFETNPPRSSLAVPLTVDQRVLGVLELQSNELNAFQESHMPGLHMAAKLSAVAARNIELLERERAARQEAEALNEQLRERLQQLSILQHDVRESNERLREAYDTTIEGWARALDLRDHETEGHSRRVGDMTVALAKRLDLADRDLTGLRHGALLHDIGKIAVPDSILLKPGKLSEEEWKLMKRHPRHAYELLRPIEFLRESLDIPYCHHERWDGTGYPRGLRGEEIPLAARMFAVVDVYDALTSERPYRPAWRQEEALTHIREAAGTHFDPKVVEVFLGMF